MRSVGREVTEERLVFLRAGLNPLLGFPEKHVGAVATGLHEAAVAANDWVKVTIVRRIAAAAGVALANAARPMDKDSIKAPLTGLIGVFVTQMPLAKDAAGVAGSLEQLRQRGGREGQPLPLMNRVGHTRAKLMSAGHQGRPGWSTGGADMKLGQPHALVTQPVELRCLENGIAVAADIAIALVVSHHIDDVGPPPREL